MRNLASGFAHKAGRWLPALICGLALAGCGGVHVQHMDQGLSGVEPPTSVAILPFTRGSSLAADEVNPALILRDVFAGHFGFLGYYDLPLSEIDARARVAGIALSERLAELDPASLRKILNVDAVIKGHVLEANNFTGGIYAETRVRARLEMLDLRSGRTLWQVEHQEVDMSGLLTPTVVNFVRRQMENTDLPHAYDRVCEEFAVKVIKQLPDPAAFREMEIRLPEINSMRANFKTAGVWQPGDVIAVRLYGTPGLNASFDIGNWRTAVPMTEGAAGVYSGSYKIAEGDRVIDAVLTGRLVDARGMTRKKALRDALVTIGAPSIASLAR